jgi:transcriptional regulator GlxA family with amidase domain
MKSKAVQTGRQGECNVREEPGFLVDTDQLGRCRLVCNRNPITPQRDHPYRQQPTATEALIDHRVRTVIQLLQNNPAQQIALDELAASIRISPAGLRLLFRRHVGISPLRYLKQLRLERARVLLCTTHLSVKEVMVTVGCADESHFVRDFEKTHGLSPARYRVANFSSASVTEPPINSRSGQ